MYHLFSAIQDVQVLLSLPPEELAGKILFLIRKHENPDKLNPANMMQDAETMMGNQAYGTLSREHERDVGLAIAEALSWLEAHGLMVPQAGMEGTNGWRRLSRRARHLKDENDFAQYAKARHLPRKNLNPRIAQAVWMAFMRGEYDVAVFQAMKAVEVAVREASGSSELGVKLMRDAFRPDSGPLTDQTTEKGEQEARMGLFAGAIGSFKNPQSHRDVNLEDAGEAMEVIMLANHLLRIVEGRRRVTPAP